MKRIANSLQEKNKAATTARRKRGTKDDKDCGLCSLLQWTHYKFTRVPSFACDGSTNVDCLSTDDVT